MEAFLTELDPGSELMHEGTLYDRLDADVARAFVDGRRFVRYRCTAQEVRELCEAARDLVDVGRARHRRVVGCR